MTVMIIIILEHPHHVHPPYPQYTSIIRHHSPESPTTMFLNCIFVVLVITFFIFLFDSAEISKNDCMLFGDSIAKHDSRPDDCRWLSPCCFHHASRSCRFRMSLGTPYITIVSLYITIVWKYIMKIHAPYYHHISCTIYPISYHWPYITILSPWVLPPLCCTP